MLGIIGGLLPLFFFFFCTEANAAAEGRIDPRLQRTLRRSPSTNVVVKMKGGIEPAIARSRRMKSASREAHINNFVNLLEMQAFESQAALMAYLNRERRMDGVESYWASNSIFIPNADAELVFRLSLLDNVEEIHQEHIITIDDPIFETPDNNSTTASMEGSLQWGIEKVQAHSTWEKGNTGEGIIVGGIDTGVRATHSVLKDNFVGLDKNGWYDPYKKSAAPQDGNGHGTHTMGTIVGTHGYGVAPGAKWLACMGCSSSSCTEKALLACGQYILCPTDTQGLNRNCAFAPHLSSNSWGGGANQMWYMDTVKAWREAGIIPIFAQGNSGNRCGTANSPGDYPNVIGVGASTSANRLATFSSVGPTRKELLKPDVSAPGHNVRSAWHTGDDEFKSISGTSMACPHVAGAVALLLAHDTTLDYDGVYNALILGSSTNLQAPNKNCGGIRDSTYPNNMFGWGVIDTENAIANIGKEPPVTEPPPPTPPPEEQCFLNVFNECVPRKECFGYGWGYFCVQSCDC